MTPIAVSLLPGGRRWAYDVADYGAASALRRLVTQAVREEASGGGDFAAVELILGELLGNVARHTPGPVVVDFEIVNGCAYVAVSDKGPGLTPGSRGLPRDPLSEGGRGMFLVEQLSRRVEVCSTAEGTAVRVELPVDPRVA